jgi:hypothetical protein
MPADSDIVDYLATGGYGTKGTSIFYANMPDTPDNCITVIQTGGHKPEPWEDLEYTGLQVIIRNSDPDTARTNADGILAYLAGKTHLTINSRRYHWIEAQGSPSDGGYDEEMRRLFTIGFIVCKDMEG